ncbi:hypothetical protein [Salipiger marinus]|uniref:Lipoprotein n=1 Tax=Salipiger marinus TaxID=555512 RepID=A0A1G8LK48_9RHOB|nr:hypothetical protein [Salipiger marinus]SDI56051.1 hypothetical protein SAMN04487993_1006211 [Salipiger marinus]
MRLTSCLTLICGMCLTTGCADPARKLELVPTEGPLFCDVEQPRRFTREELEVRSDRWPENLRLDIKTNTTWDRECAPEIQQHSITER